MDRADMEKGLTWLKPQVPPRRNGRAIKVYAEFLDMNFYLDNPSRRPPSTAVLALLAHQGIKRAWKKGAELFPRHVNFPELMLKMLVNSQGHRH